MTEITNSLPHSREAEEAVIGSTLINPEVYLEVAQFLSPEDFYVHRHRWIWEAFARLQERRVPIDFLTLSDELDRSGKLAEVGGPAYLTALLNGTPTSLHAEHYGRIVEETALRRRMLLAAQNVAKLAYHQQSRIDTVLEEAEKAIFDVDKRHLIHEIQPFSQVLDNLYERVEHVSRARAQGMLRGLPTGFIDLDRILGGMQPSDVLIAAGRPGMGKSGFLVSIARYVAHTAKRRVALFSLEMSREQMALRMVSQQSEIEGQRLRNGTLQDEQWTAFTQAVETLNGVELFIDDTPGLTPVQLRARCRRLHLEYGLDLILIDYLQLMSGGGKFENRVQEISYISRQLKSLARELDVPILAAAQLSRAVEQRADKRPVLSDLRESGSIEQDSDVVMFLYRPETADRAPGGSPVSPVDVIVAKHRNGPVGAVQLVFRPDLTKFDNAVKETHLQ